MTKKAIFWETKRMKSDGMFVGCCYVKGERKRTKSTRMPTVWTK